VILRAVRARSGLTPQFVIPAKAGTHLYIKSSWVPGRASLARDDKNI